LRLLRKEALEGYQRGRVLRPLRAFLSLEHRGEIAHNLRQHLNGLGHMTEVGGRSPSEPPSFVCLADHIVERALRHCCYPFVRVICQQRRSNSKSARAILGRHHLTAALSLPKTYHAAVV
jgi:hypothetical protein